MLLIDAIVLKVRDGAVANRPVYVAIGISVDGIRDVLGLWMGPSGGEGAKQWMNMLTELRNRGILDACIVCCDGLKGLPEAIGAVWPAATVQTSSVDTRARRDGLAGHRTTGRGPMQTRAFEALMQTRPSRWRRAA